MYSIAAAPRVAQECATFVLSVAACENRRLRRLVPFLLNEINARSFKSVSLNGALVATLFAMDTPPRR